MLQNLVDTKAAAISGRIALPIGVKVYEKDLSACCAHWILNSGWCINRSEACAFLQPESSDDTAILRTECAA